jgi:hypothetical protein
LLVRGRVYYGKQRGNHGSFIARKLLPHFNAVWGVQRKLEHEMLSGPARSILSVLRKEWEMSTNDLRLASGIRERSNFNCALDQLQKVFKVIASEVTYEPTFSYLWSLAEARFAEEMETKVNREDALKEIARAYLAGAGMTSRGELARVTGLSKPDAGLGNWALVEEGFARRLSPGVYRLTSLD